MKPIAVAIGLMVFLAWPGAAADDARPPADSLGKRPVFASELAMVYVTVTVRDGQGQLVTGLAADDFTVFEDGRPQKIELFARAIEPGHEEEMALDLGILFDTSQSMAQQIRLTQASAIRFLDTIPRAHDLLVIFFDQDIRISRYDSEQQQGLFERILDTSGQGNTALYDAVAAYVSKIEGAAGRKVLVLFSDGADSTSRLNQGEALDLIRSSGVVVYPISFARTSFGGSASRHMAARAVLQRFADESGGEMFEPSSSREVAKAYQRILEDFTGQYVVGFVSDRPSHDVKLRKLRVALRRPIRGSKARHRPSYYPAVH